MVLATREVIETEINWPCTVYKLYSEYNQGCRLGVSRAINWFFDQVEEGIILEDDCIPHPSFFVYCATLLERYRDDTRVWCISGNNFQDGQWRGDGSYYFSRYNHCWGWATWRDSWRFYDSDLKNWTSLLVSGLLKTIFDDPIELAYWQRIWQGLLLTGKPDSWAYRWTFTCLSNGGLTALPNQNLVCNVGFGDDGTNTVKMFVDTSIGNAIDPTQHPSFVLRDSNADHYTFYEYFGGKWERFPFSVFLSLKLFIRNVLKKSRVLP